MTDSTNGALPPQLRDLSYGARETLAAIAGLFGEASVADDSPTVWSATQLGTERSRLVAARQSLTATQIRVVGTVLAADLAALKDDAVLSGPGDGDPPTWSPFDTGGDQPSSVPARLVAKFPAGTLSEIAVCVFINDEDYDRQLTVYAAEGQHDAAHGVLADFLQRASGPANPLRGKTLRARQMPSGSMVLDMHPTPTDKRAELVLPGEVWREVDLNTAVIGNKHDTLERLGLGTSRGILLAGPPGVGKTHLTRVIAAELVGDCTVIFADASAVTHAVTELYHEAEYLGRCVIVLEDIDLVVGHRGSGAGPLLADFLATLDGVRQRHGLLTIATTNDPGAIDPAAQRSARFDSVVTIPAPDGVARREILQRYLGPLGLDLTLTAVAGHLDGASGADLREVVRRAVLEFGESFTDEDLVDVATSGRWRTAVNTGQYL